MISNLKQVFENINNMYENIHFTLNEKKSSADSLYFTTTIESDYFKGQALVTGIVDDTGVMRLIMTFGEIEETPEAYNLINEYNKFAAWGKAYIGTLNGKKFLEIRSANCLEIEDAMAPVLFKYFFDDLLSEDLNAYLKPIVELTK